MTTYYSAERTKSTTVPATMLKPNEAHGHVRQAFFSYATPAGGLAVDDVLSLCSLPAGARILGGRIAFEAMSTGAGAASIRIGTSTTTDAYLGDTSVDAAGVSAIADTIALGYGTVTTAATVLQATVKTEAWAAAKKLYGHMLYVVD